MGLPASYSTFSMSRESFSQRPRIRSRSAAGSSDKVRFTPRLCVCAAGERGRRSDFGRTLSMARFRSVRAGSGLAPMEEDFHLGGRGVTGSFVCQDTYSIRRIEKRHERGWVTCGPFMNTLADL